jgi:hypothetical protein
VVFKSTPTHVRDVTEKLRSSRAAPGCGRPRGGWSIAGRPSQSKSQLASSIYRLANHAHVYACAQELSAAYSQLAEAKLGSTSLGGPGAAWMHTSVKWPIEWLHVPKTGTTFRNTLLLWVCPELPPSSYANMSFGAPQLPPECSARFRLDPSGRKGMGMAEHVSLVNRTDAELSSVFTFMRSPAERLTSAFHHDARQAARWSKAHMNAGILNYNVENATQDDICSYVSNSSFTTSAMGAQNRMIVGDRLLRVYGTLVFSSPALPDAEKVHEACRRLQLFAFVGITSYWNASICLFHEMFGGTTHGIEVASINSGGYSGGRLTSDCGDRADAQVFMCAKGLFLERIKSYPKCQRFVED